MSGVYHFDHTRSETRPKSRKWKLAYEKISKPLYIQIQDYLTDLIVSGKILPEQRILSEREYSDDLGVSRMTVRKAITELVNDGLLERRHGSGTYVAKPKVTYRCDELLDYPLAMESRNISTTSQLLEFEEIVSSRILSKTLNLELGNPLFRVTLLRFANRVPIILERVFFPMQRFPDLQEWNLEKSSLMNLITEIYKYQIHLVTQTIDAISATNEVALQLRVEEGFPLLMLNKVIYDKNDRAPIVYKQDILRSDYTRIEVNNNMGGTAEFSSSVTKGGY